MSKTVLISDPKTILTIIVSIVFLKFISFLWKIFSNLRKNYHYSQCSAILKRLYHDINAFEVSLNHRKKNDINSSSFIYGEIVFSSFTEVLAIVRPKKNEIFYDLGCGAGKAVFTTSLLYPDTIVRGVELLQPLYHLCQDLKTSLKKMMLDSNHFKQTHLNAIFIEGDLTTIDLSEINIVYLNVTCFDHDAWSDICDKIESLPIHARVILTSKYLTSKSFELIYQQPHLMSWGFNTINVYLKIE